MANLWQTDFEDDEHLLPGFPKFEKASLEETRVLTMEKIYQVTVAEFVPLTLSLPKKGQIHLIAVGGVRCWFQIESVSLERVGTLLPSALTGRETLRADTFLVRALLKMSLLQEGADPSVPPWQLPCYRFRATPVPMKTTVRTFYPTRGDALFGAGASVSLVPMPLVNTAGVPLAVDSSRVLTRFRFCYNLESTTANYAAALDWCWRWPGHCNATTVRFAGIEFPPLTLMFESFSFEYCEEPYSYEAVVDGAQATVSGTWHYLKCEARLLADPLTFARNYLNVGAHTLSRSGIERLWNWTDATGKLVFGRYAEAAKHADAQEVSENLFLDEAGSGISPFAEDGRQTPTYRCGVLEMPYDFNRLGLPEGLPIA
jgi:hypothetical protein